MTVLTHGFKDDNTSSVTSNWLVCPNCNVLYEASIGHTCTQKLQVGWICPNCNTGVAPWKESCPECSDKENYYYGGLF